MTIELLFSLFFFFQAEDGIRDLTVTGVQTCALPISDLARPDARIAVQVVPLDLARRVVGRLVGRVGSGRAVGRPGRELDEALLAGEDHGARSAGAAEPGGRLDRVVL